MLSKVTDDRVNESQKKAEKLVISWRYTTENAMQNIDNWLVDNYQLRYNEVSSDYEMKSLSSEEEEWEVGEVDKIYHAMKRAGVKGQRGDITKGDVQVAFRVMALKNSYDPFKNYFENLPEWDGHDRIKEIADGICYTHKEDRIAFERQFKRHLLRSVSQSIDADVNRYVFVFVSKQKTGKSTFIRRINPLGRDYYTEEMFVADNKDNQIALTSNYIYNMEEIENMNKKEISQFKAIVSKQTVNVRLPYASKATSIPRRCTFFGSTNNEHILSDDENTRWIIFSIEHFKKDSRGRFLFMKIDMAQMWSQIYSLYRRKFSGELGRRDSDWIVGKTKNYRMESFEEDWIEKIYVSGTKNDPGCYLLKASEVAMTIWQRSNATVKPTSWSVSKALKVLGHKSVVVKIKGKLKRGYWLREVAKDNILQSDNEQDNDVDVPF